MMIGPTKFHVPNGAIVTDQVVTKEVMNQAGLTSEGMAMDQVTSYCYK